MKFLSALQAGVIVDGAWITANANGLEFSTECIENGDDVILQSRLVNRSGKSVKVSRFVWKQEGIQNDALTMPGKDIRVYCEGWTMASPASCRKFGECDFKYHPDYMRSAVALADDYVANVPNHFRFEYVTVIRNAAENKNLLAGFVTSDKQFTGGKMVLCDKGVETLELICECDGCELPDGATIESEKLLIFAGNDDNAMLCHFADVWGKEMNARNNTALPIGWCSWYYYFEHVTQDDMIKNADFIAANRDKYPLKYLQLDDGYQTACGDWLSCNSQFPNGLEWLAGEIKKRGFIPGLWLAPFFVESNSKLLKDHPDWILRDKDGNPLVTAKKWHGLNDNYGLDCTNPAVLDHLKKLYAEIRRIGFDYIKLDFMMAACNVAGAVYYDKTATRAQALRRGLSAIREGFGDDGYMLGCTVPFGPTVGLVNGNRISTDITPYWIQPGETNAEAPTVPNVCRNNINHTYMHKRLWNNDPDTLIVRKGNNDLTENEARLWCDAVKLAGGALILSDNLPELEADRAAWTQELIADPDGYTTFPGDRMECTHPMIWNGVHKKTGAKVTGFFNLTNENMPQADAHASKIKNS